MTSAEKPNDWGSWKVRFSAWLAGVQYWQGRLTHIMTGIIIQAWIWYFSSGGNNYSGQNFGHACV